MAKVFSIFADERNDHSKMVKQLLSNEVPPLPKSKPNPHRPPSATATKSAPTKSKHTKVAVQVPKDDVNKTSR